MAQFRPKDHVEPIVLETDAILNKIANIELLGEEIIADRHLLIDLGKKTNSNREAIRALKSKKNEEKSWLCIGSTFFKIQDKNISKVLEKDQSNLGQEIDNIRTKLKDKVSKLHELEGLEDVSRFSLSSLSLEDRKYVNL
eukprot:gene18743-20632_t